MDLDPPSVPPRPTRCQPSGSGPLEIEENCCGAPAHRARCIRHPSAPARRGAARETLTEAQLRRVADHVDERLDTPLTLAELAGVAGMRRFVFARAFRAARGVSPHQFVLRARVERARTLLRTTDERIDRIALRTGFAHQSHLTRTYRRLLGTTPARERAGR